MAVTRAERAVVDLAKALVDGSDPRIHLPALAAAASPTGLSPEALGAIREVLCKGAARMLVRGGSGSPWKDGVPLRFGSASLDLLSWLHSAPVGRADRPELVVRSAPTPVEALLLARAVELVHAAGGVPPGPALRSPWVWMLAGRWMAVHAPPPALDWSALSSEGFLLDTLQGRLSEAWTAWAREVRAGDAGPTTAHGEAQERLVAALLAGCASRPERALFLGRLVVGLAALPPRVFSVERGELKLVTWQRARRARVGLLRAAAEGFGGWERRWRAIGFVEDGFDDAQRELRRFEDVFSACRAVAGPIAEADALPTSSHGTEEQP